ncbi:hypothetical protein MTO96_023472 [Rhipicephalus appendiculatus]
MEGGRDKTEERELERHRWLSRHGANKGDREGRRNVDAPTERRRRRPGRANALNAAKAPQRGGPFPPLAIARRRLLRR